MLSFCSIPGTELSKWLAGVIKDTGLWSLSWEKFTEETTEAQAENQKEN